MTDSLQEPKIRVPVEQAAQFLWSRGSGPREERIIAGAVFSGAPGGEEADDDDPRFRVLVEEATQFPIAGYDRGFQGGFGHQAAKIVAAMFTLGDLLYLRLGASKSTLDAEDKWLIGSLIVLSHDLTRVNKKQTPELQSTANHAVLRAELTTGHNSWFRAVIERIAHFLQEENLWGFQSEDFVRQMLGMEPLTVQERYRMDQESELDKRVVELAKRLEDEARSPAPFPR